MRSTIATLCALLTLASARAQSTDFFEKKIRPVLVEHCYACHSVEAGKRRGSLTLDTREAVLKGGDSGPALVPGQPEKSLLLAVLRYHGDIKMPPKSKLPDAVIADFATWIKQGAPDPRSGTAVKSKSQGMSLEEGRKFWAYQPIRKPPIPAVKDRAWGRTEIDAFILAQLEAKGMTPAADAEPGVLLRRLYFDLIGLPPTPKEIADFGLRIADSRQSAIRNPQSAMEIPQSAIESVVDELLASPRFGERWGRHWLDIVRYGESLTLRGFVLNEAWRYRDYVIDSFNQDVPLDRFIREQLAGDLLLAATPADRRRQLIAAAFLTLGNNNLEEQDIKLFRMDVVDENLDTIGKAFLGQTIGCARCHDHKFDPIPQRDYYALAGILRSTRIHGQEGNLAKWLEVPLPSLTGDEAAIRANEEAIAKLKQEIAALGKSGKPAAAQKRIVPVKALPGIVIDDSQAMKVGVWMHSTSSNQYIGDGYIHDQNAGQGDKTLTFQAALPHSGKYEVRFAYTPGTNRAPAVAVTVFSEEGDKTILVNEQLPPPLDGLFVSLGQYQFEKTGQSYVMVSNKDAKGHVIADAVAFIPVEQLKEAKVQPAAAKETGRLKQLEEQLKKLQAQGPRRELTLGVMDHTKIEDARLHIRGSAHNLGDEVPRGFLQVATPGTMPALPANASGRRELADWIVSPTNPLTARVLANRLWHWTFGEGLTRTPDNLGSTGERPSHPELLDYLAAKLMEDGWSTKKLLRLLVLSRTYRQSAHHPASAGDPENRLFARAQRQRLEAECLRDAMLAVSGQLKLDRAGSGFSKLASDYNYQYKDTCRSVYVPVFRNALPEIFEVFDFADPSVTSGRRSASTVAQQALFMMNNPFVLEQARHTARRLLEAKELDDSGRITLAYRLILGRPPRAEEQRLLMAYVAVAAANERQDAWARCVQTLFASIEFRFVN